MESPFIDVSVVPTYGTLNARILWRMRDDFSKGLFIISRSPDGLNDWQDIGSVENTDQFVDPKAITGGKLDLLHYQVTLRIKDKEYRSSVINTLGALSRQEFGAVYRIMQQEYQKLTEFTKIAICKMRISGPSCPKCVDEDTGQKTGISLCTTCYGTGYQGGFWPPAISFMQPLDQSAKVQSDNPDGSGATDPLHCRARMVAFPSLIKNDMLVDTAADKRYSVETQDISYFKGKVPLINMAGLVLIRRTDIRYQFPTK